MMNKRKRGRPPKPIGPPEWTRIERAALRINDHFDSLLMTATDLEKDLQTGRLPSAIRAFDKRGVEVEARPLEPQYWEQIDFLVTDREIHVRWRTADASPDLEKYYFVSSAALHQCYPEGKSEQVPVATGFPRKSNRGTKSDIDWKAVDVAAAGLMVRNKYSTLVEFEKAVFEHFEEKWPRDDIDNSTLNRQLSALYYELKAALGI
jgi:hypothetical protein